MYCNTLRQLGRVENCIAIRGGKIGPTRWASPVRPKLGPGRAIKLLARKKSGQIWPGPVWPGPARYGPARPSMARYGPTLPVRIFFALKRLFVPTVPVFREGWAVKILARKNRANFGPARFWPGPLLARPSPPRLARLPPLIAIHNIVLQRRKFGGLNLGCNTLECIAIEATGLA